MKNLKLKARVIEKYGNQSLFCLKAGMREDRLSRLIHGRSTPSDKEKATISRRLGAKPDDIFPSK